MPKLWTALCEKNLHQHTQHPFVYTAIPVLGVAAVVAGLNVISYRMQKKELEAKGITL